MILEQIKELYNDGIDFAKTMGEGLVKGIRNHPIRTLTAIVGGTAVVAFGADANSPAKKTNDAVKSFYQGMDSENQSEILVSGDSVIVTEGKKKDIRCNALDAMNSLTNGQLPDSISVSSKGAAARGAGLNDKKTDFNYADGARVSLGKSGAPWVLKAISTKATVGDSAVGNVNVDSLVQHYISAVNTQMSGAYSAFEKLHAPTLEKKKAFDGKEAKLDSLLGFMTENRFKYADLSAGNAKGKKINRALNEILNMSGINVVVDDKYHPEETYTYQKSNGQKDAKECKAGAECKRGVADKQFGGTSLKAANDQRAEDRKINLEKFVAENMTKYNADFAALRCQTAEALEDSARYEAKQAGHEEVGRQLLQKMYTNELAKEVLTANLKAGEHKNEKYEKYSGLIKGYLDNWDKKGKDGLTGKERFIKAKVSKPVTHTEPVDKIKKAYATPGDFADEATDLLNRSNSGFRATVNGKVASTETNWSQPTVNADDDNKDLGVKVEAAGTNWFGTAAINREGMKGKATGQAFDYNSMSYQAHESNDTLKATNVAITGGYKHRVSNEQGNLDMRVGARVGMKQSTQTTSNEPGVEYDAHDAHVGVEGMIGAENKVARGELSGGMQTSTNSNDYRLDINAKAQGKLGKVRATGTIGYEADNQQNQALDTEERVPAGIAIDVAPINNFMVGYGFELDLNKERPIMQGEVLNYVRGAINAGNDITFEAQVGHYQNHGQNQTGGYAEQSGMQFKAGIVYRINQELGKNIVEPIKEMMKK